MIFIKELIKTKRFKYLVVIILLVLFSTSLSIAFSTFTSNSLNEAANAKLMELEYSMTIDEQPGEIIQLKAREEKIVNIKYTSLNYYNTKYELIYRVCTDESCSAFIPTPDEIKVQFASTTPNSVQGTVNSMGTVSNRVAIINNKTEDYYIKFIINTGFIHNTLVHENVINSEYCEFCLNKKILAQNEGRLNVESKPAPNYDQIAPVAVYGEVTATITTTYTSSNNKAIGSGYTFNESTGRYTLTGVETSKSYGTSYIGYYTCTSTAFVNCLNIYKINTVSGTSITNSTRYSSQITYNTSDTGLFATEDDYGMSYYFRGDKESLNNNIIYAEYQWKIIRINGDGSVRLIYNDTCPNNNCSINQASSSLNVSPKAYNLNYDDNKYLGYMYGGSPGVRSDSKTEAQTNTTSSTIKETLDAWYQTNIVNKWYNGYISDSLFCNDRQPAKELGLNDSYDTGNAYSSFWTYYGSFYRLYTNKTPSLKCNQKNDRFTVNDAINGNAALTHPVALLTADEAALAGLKANTSNIKNYLHSTQYYWTMSPSYFYGDNASARLWAIYSNGTMNDLDLYEYDYLNIRPVINLESFTTVTGDGSASNPYKVS